MHELSLIHISYVTIPKDLSKVKNKVFLNLTKRQLVCMGFAAGSGVPFYFLMRDTLGTSNAAAGMVLLMLPEFFFALYENCLLYTSYTFLLFFCCFGCHRGEKPIVSGFSPATGSATG